MTTDNQPTSGAEAAALIVALLPETVRVELYPQWSDGSGVTVRRTRVILFDARGVIGADRDEHVAVLRVLRRVAGADWNRPQTFDVAAGGWRSAPVLLPLPEALGSDGPIPYMLTARAETEGRVREGQLAEQRHQLLDPAVPPLAVSL